MEVLLSLFAFIIFVLIYSAVITHYVPRKLYSFINLIVGLGSVVFGHLVGLSLSEMGLSLLSATKGLLYGGFFLIPILLVVLIALFAPILRPFFHHSPIRSSTRKAVLYELGFRIPFGTAFSEELLFRGVLFGLLARSSSTWVAVVVSSLVFGLWHIAPTIKTIGQNEAFQTLIGKQKKLHGLSILLHVVITTLAGIGFSLLRVVSGSLLAPWLVHTFINVISASGSYVLSKLARNKR